MLFDLLASCFGPYMTCEGVEKAFIKGGICRIDERIKMSK